MKRALKQKSSLYQYLDSTKVLELGTEQDIVRARIEHWKDYKKNWAKERRRKTKTFEVVFNKDELKDLVLGAKMYKKMSNTRLIKTACLAYLQRRFLVPDAYAIGIIRQLLTMNYTYLQMVFIDENKVPFEAGKELLMRMAELENGVLSALVNPKTLEQCILEELQRNASFKTWLIELFKTYEYHN